MSVTAYSKKEAKSHSWVASNYALYKEGKVVTGKFVTNKFLGYKELTGEKLDDFRAVIRAGGSATTNLTAKDVNVIAHSPRVEMFATTEAEPSAGSVVASSHSRFQDTYTSVSSLGFPNVTAWPSSNSTASQAQGKIYQKLAKFNGTTALGELRQSLLMLRNPALGLRHAIDKYRAIASHRRSQVTAPTLREMQAIWARLASDLWLEYNFGWKPLYNDIADALDAFNSKANGTFTDIVHARAETVAKASNSTLAPGQPAGTLFVNGSVTTKIGVNISAGARLSVDVDNYVEKLGLSPENWIPAAWELMPWSFLIDYFTNIGIILDSTAIASRTGWSYVSQTTRKVSTYEAVDGIQNVNPGYNVTSGRINCEAKTVSRSSMTSVPIPSFQTSMKLSTTRGLNIAALIVGRTIDSRYKPPVGPTR